MTDHITARRIQTAMAKLGAAGRRSKLHHRLTSPVVGSRPDVDEYGLAILRPVRADEAAQEHEEALERFAAASRRLSRRPAAADDAVTDTVSVVATCKMVPPDSEIGAQL